MVKCSIINRTRFCWNLVKYRKFGTSDVAFWFTFCKRCKVDYNARHVESFKCPVMNFESCSKNEGLNKSKK